MSVRLTDFAPSCFLLCFGCTLHLQPYLKTGAKYFAQKQMPLESSGKEELTIYIGPGTNGQTLSIQI